jgi:hypothetical protein
MIPWRLFGCGRHGNPDREFAARFANLVADRISYLDLDIMLWKSAKSELWISRLPF